MYVFILTYETVFIASPYIYIYMVSNVKVFSRDKSQLFRADALKLSL